MTIGPCLPKSGAVLAPVKHASRRFAVACGHAWPRLCAAPLQSQAGTKKQRDPTEQRNITRGKAGSARLHNLITATHETDLGNPGPST
jgi:hypothetical protein